MTLFEQFHKKIADCATLHDLELIKEEVKSAFDADSDERLELLGFAGMVEDYLTF